MLVCSKFGKNILYVRNVMKERTFMQLILTKGPFMQNGWGMREKFKSIRVILQKVVSVVKL
jgi:hypothetical protein